MKPTSSRPAASVERSSGPTSLPRLEPLIGERQVEQRLQLGVHRQSLPVQYRSGTKDWCSIGGRMWRPLGSGRGGSFAGAAVTSS